ncbi:MAG: hypothetical protein JNM63_03785 [Spirochaetia bacterium]|nr:hypothetical protein [Spirochaetia bacterium]
MIKKIAMAVAGLALVGSAFAQNLPKFGMEGGAQTTPLGTIRVPYTTVVNYFGYVKPGSTPDGTENGKKMYYLYLWVPIVAPEIGIRMVSPWKAAYGKPDVKKGDFVAPDWAEGEKDTKNYFDTWVSLERSTIVAEADITSAKVKSAQWFKYGNNDDDSELPAQPSGSKYNSTLRVVSTPSDPLKALTRGLYRIGFTTYKVGEVQGSFFAQVGAPIKIPGTVLGKDVDAVGKEAVAGASKK